MERLYKDYRGRFSIFKLLIVAQVALFGAMYLIGRGQNTDVLINFGAKFNYAIVNGEWWRLVTPMFLHIDLMHLAFNMSALWIISQSIEAVMGTRKLLLLYFLSGIGGVVLSFAFNNNISAGASGAIFGMMGAHLYLFLRNKELYRHIFGTSFLTLIAINLVYGFIQPQVDDLGHLGGLLAGFMAAYVLGVLNETLSLKRAIAGVLGLLIFVGVGYYGYGRYEKSAHYQYFYVIDLAKQGKDKEAVEALMDAYKRFPDSPELMSLVKSLQ